MTYEETIKANVLIAKFMGGEYIQALGNVSARFYFEKIPGNLDDGPLVYCGQMEYATSWEWLIPVYAKIKMLCDGFKCQYAGKYNPYEVPFKVVYDAFNTVNVTLLWVCCIEFIILYNKLNDRAGKGNQSE